MRNLRKKIWIDRFQTYLSIRLAGLPEPQRVAVMLKHCDGRSVAEIGMQLGRTPAAVASLLRRGLKHLRERLDA